MNSAHMLERQLRNLGEGLLLHDRWHVVFALFFLHVPVTVGSAGDLPLEDSLKVFEEGVALARRCAKYLEEAEKRIELLTKDESGLLKIELFEWDKDSQG